jgi:deferrochelatase/peroxidase EfeB
MTPPPKSHSEPPPEEGGGSGRSGVTRRTIFTGAAGLGLGVGLERAVSPSRSPEAPATPGQAAAAFHGRHQAGIATRPQAHVHFAAFDLTTRTRRALRRLLGEWSAAAAALTAGREYSTAGPPGRDPGEAVDLAPAELTVTFGLGPGLFGTGPADPLGLGGARPASLKPLPAFAGEDLDPGRTGGDLCVQACANDAQVAFHAVHVMSRIAGDDARLRWSLSGFRPLSSALSPTQNPRNLLGFRDGTNNISDADSAALERFVWVQPSDGPRWMVGGSYLIARQVEFDLSSWDALGLAEQDRTIGRHKQSGAPLGGRYEHDTVNLHAVDRQGNPIIPADAHIRVASDEVNGGVRILRRSYSFSRPSAGGGKDPMSGQLDGGLLFIAFVRDPRQFITLQRRLSTGDALSAFTIHVGSALFACPPGTTRGGFVGESLLS